MFNLFKNKQQDPIERGGAAVRHASQAAKLVPFRYLLSTTEGYISFSQYTGMFVEKDKVHILSEHERAAIAELLTDMRGKNIISGELK